MDNRKKKIALNFLNNIPTEHREDGNSNFRKRDLTVNIPSNNKTPVAISNNNNHSGNNNHHLNKQNHSNHHHVQNNNHHSNHHSRHHHHRNTNDKRRQHERTKEKALDFLSNIPMGTNTNNSKASSATTVNSTDLVANQQLGTPISAPPSIQLDSNACFVQGGKNISPKRSVHYSLNNKERVHPTGVLANNNLIHYQLPYDKRKKQGNPHLPRHLKPINNLQEIYDVETVDNTSSNPSTSTSSDSSCIEEADDDYIRRLNLFDKKSTVPFALCSFIKPARKASPNTVNNTSTGGILLNNNNSVSPVGDTTFVNTTTTNFAHHESTNSVVVPITTNAAQSESPLSTEELIKHQLELENTFIANKKPQSYRPFILDKTEDNYDPLYLDDPNIRTASKRKVMTLPGLVTSTIPFLKSKALKKDLNEQFRQQHEDCLLTLSKIRKLKRRMVKAITRSKVDELSIVAVACVYLEKLILKNFVNKQNRKRIAAVCLLIAFKVSIDSPAEERKVLMSQLLDEIESAFEVSRKKFLPIELFIMSEGLHFDLIPSLKDIQPHLQRLMSDEQDNVQYTRYINSNTSLYSPSSPKISL
ncbi:hypothetical protein ABK040_015615 [Willaertia magna]